MTSPVTIDLQGVPLKLTLELLLKQLGLSYKVKGGLLVIDFGEDEATPLRLLEDKAERGELTPAEATKLLDMLKTINQIRKLKAEGRKLEQEAKQGRQ